MTISVHGMRKMAGAPWQATAGASDGGGFVTGSRRVLGAFFAGSRRVSFLVEFWRTRAARARRFLLMARAEPNV